MNCHGYHRDCYQRYTKNSDRHEETEQTSSFGMNRRSLIAANKWNDGFLFNKDCIFCNKMDRIKVRVRGVWTRERLSYFEFGDGDTIQEIAIKNKNFELLTRIKDADLFSKEAMYHASCRKSFIQNPSAWRSSNPLTIDNQKKMEKAHRATFSSVLEVIDRDIILVEKIVQLSYLTKIYTESLSKIDFTNNNYCPENLKAKIENCSKYKNSISFAKPREFESVLIYNNKILAEKLICESFQPGTNKQKIFWTVIIADKVSL